jgi:hypothetical protein
MFKKFETHNFIWIVENIKYVQKIWNPYMPT